MSAIVAAAPAPVAATPKKVKKSTGPKKEKVPKAHPGVALMINAAIDALKERNGSSLQAIKKYIQANYKVDIERLSPFIKKHLKNATGKGLLIQTKGNGASGSFKLSKNKENKPAKKVTKKITKKAGEKKPKSDAAKKVKKVKTTDKKDKKVTKKAKSPEKKDKIAKAAKPKKVKESKPKKVSSAKAKAVKKAKTPIKKTTKPKVMKVKKVDKK